MQSTLQLKKKLNTVKFFSALTKTDHLGSLTELNKAVLALKTGTKSKKKISFNVQQRKFHQN